MCLSWFCHWIHSHQITFWDIWGSMLFYTFCPSHGTASRKLKMRWLFWYFLGSPSFLLVFVTSPWCFSQEKTINFKRWDLRPPRFELVHAWGHQHVAGLGLEAGSCKKNKRFCFLQAGAKVTSYKAGIIPLIEVASYNPSETHVFSAICCIVGYSSIYIGVILAPVKPIYFRPFVGDPIFPFISGFCWPTL